MRMPETIMRPAVGCKRGANVGRGGKGMSCVHTFGHGGNRHVRSVSCNMLRVILTLWKVVAVL